VPLFFFSPKISKRAGGGNERVEPHMDSGIRTIGLYPLALIDSQPDAPYFDAEIALGCERVTRWVG
jgi:hypothetical protein